MSIKPIIFNAKNLAGEIRQLSYTHVDELPIILSQTFGYTPLYEPVWMDEDGYENFPPKNTETIFVLYIYIFIPVTFINDWCCIEDDNNNRYTEYTLLIESKDMQYVYEEIAISFFYGNHVFYGEESNINIIYEDYGALTKYIRIPEETPYFTSIKDLFLSVKNIFENIPEDFFNHLANCIDDKWTRHIK